MDNNVNFNNNCLPPISSPFASNNFVRSSNNINYHHNSSQASNYIPRNRSTISIHRYPSSGYNYQTPLNQPTSDYTYGYGTQTNEILKGYTPQGNNRILRHSPSYSSDDYFSRGNPSEEVFDLREYQRRISQREQELMQKYKNGFYGNNRLINSNNMYANQINEPKRYVSPLVLNNSKRHLVSVNPCKLIHIR